MKIQKRFQRNRLRKNNRLIDMEGGCCTKMRQPLFLYAPFWISDLGHTARHVKRQKYHTEPENTHLTILYNRIK